jgi:hypothetical protein
MMIKADHRALTWLGEPRLSPTFRPHDSIGLIGGQSIRSLDLGDPPYGQYR